MQKSGLAAFIPCCIDCTWFGANRPIIMSKTLAPTGKNRHSVALWTAGWGARAAPSWSDVNITVICETLD